ncbi:MAG: HutD family protein [Clostridia bacterium]
MQTKIITQADYLTTVWSGGKTRQIFIYPTCADYAKRDFLFRVSSATIEIEQSNFTILPNINRFIAPIGCSFTLQDQHTKQNIRLNNCQIYEFNGSCPITCYGKGQDLNLFTTSGVCGSMRLCKGLEDIYLQSNQAKWCFIYAVTDIKVEITNCKIVKQFDLLCGQTLNITLNSNEIVKLKTDLNYILIQVEV